MPKVSVIIPTYNRAHFVKAAVESVLNQTFQDFDIFVVDDASTDETGDIVLSLKDPRIKYVRHPSNKGNGAARNTGIQSSTGDYVALLDDDDEWLPDKLRKQVEVLNSSGKSVGCVYTGFVMIDKHSGETLAKITPSKRGSIFKDLLIQNWVGTASTPLLKRECFERVGLFDEELSSAVDWDMWIRIAEKFDFEYVAEPEVKYYAHSNRISTNYAAMIKGIEKIQEKYDALFSLDRKSYSQLCLSLGVLHCYNGDTKRGRRAFAKAIKLDPLEIRNYFNLSLSLLGADHFKKLKEFKEKWSPSLVEQA